jgi:hypothetical protein
MMVRQESSYIFHIILGCIVVATLAALGCDPLKDEAAAPLSRVNAVERAAKSAIPSGWCDVRPAAGTGPAVKLPASVTLFEGPTLDADRPTWLNLWATWCGPCVHEMPLIARWRTARLGEETDFNLEFISVDEEAGALTAFLTAHSELKTQRQRRLVDPQALVGLLSSLGLGSDTSLPVHVFLDAKGRARCVRAGGINESDLMSVRELLR